jgi:hypothetical protein
MFKTSYAGCPGAFTQSERMPCFVLMSRSGDRLPASGRKATLPFGFSQDRELVERQMMP